MPDQRSSSMKVVNRCCHDFLVAAGIFYEPFLDPFPAWTVCKKQTFTCVDELAAYCSEIEIAAHTQKFFHSGTGSKCHPCSGTGANMCLTGETSVTCCTSTGCNRPPLIGTQSCTFGAVPASTPQYTQKLYRYNESNGQYDDSSRAPGEVPAQIAPTDMIQDPFIFGNPATNKNSWLATQKCGTIVMTCSADDVTTLSETVCSEAEQAAGTHKKLYSMLSSGNCDQAIGFFAGSSCCTTDNCNNPVTGGTAAPSSSSSTSVGIVSVIGVVAAVFAM